MIVKYLWLVSLIILIGILLPNSVLSDGIPKIGDYYGISLEPKRVLGSSDKALKANIRYEAFKDVQKEKIN